MEGRVSFADDGSSSDSGSDVSSIASAYGELLAAPSPAAAAAAGAAASGPSPGLRPPGEAAAVPHQQQRERGAIGSVVSAKRKLDAAVAPVVAKLRANDPDLWALKLRQCHVGPLTGDALEEALAENQFLLEINFADCRVSSAGLSFAMQALGSNESTSVAHVEMLRCGLRDASGEALASGCRRLSILRLSGNAIGDAGAAALAPLIGRHMPLVELLLDSNRVGDSGTSALAAELRQSSVLRILDLGNNRVGPIGAEALAAALPPNKSLHSLGLKSNRIGALGATHLARALLRNDGLGAIDARNCSLGDLAASQLTACMEGHPTLCIVKVTGNGEARCTCCVCVAGRNGLKAVVRKVHVNRYQKGERHVIE